MVGSSANILEEKAQHPSETRNKMWDIEEYVDEMVDVASFSPEKVLQDAVFAAAPALTRSQVEELVDGENKQEGLTEMTQEEKNNIYRAVNVRDNIIDRMSKRGLSITSPDITGLRTFRQRNYTVVLLNDEVIGVAKRHKKDKINFNSGLNLAIYRAVKRIIDTQNK